MTLQRSEPTPTRINIIMADASNLPVHHVNAMNLRSGSDEFYFTLGVVPPPDQTEIAAVTEAGHIIAQPVFRFALSRDTMEQFLTLMADQFDQQTTLLQRLHSLREETSKKEVNHNE